MPPTPTLGGKIKQKGIGVCFTYGLYTVRPSRRLTLTEINFTVICMIFFISLVSNKKRK